MALPMAKAAQVTRILHGQGRHKAKAVRREHIAERADPRGRDAGACPRCHKPPATATPTGKRPGSPLAPIRCAADAWPCRRTGERLLPPAGPQLPGPPTPAPVVFEATGAVGNPWGPGSTGLISVPGGRGLSGVRPPVSSSGRDSDCAPGTTFRCSNLPEPSQCSPEASLRYPDGTGGGPVDDRRPTRPPTARPRPGFPYRHRPKPG